MSRASTHISVVIPTFNEQDNIVPLIRRTLHACTTHGLQPEVIVVDDNSRDLTAQQVINAFGQNAAIKLFVRKNERGLGTAIYFGVTRAKNPIIVSMDGDGNHLPEDIPNLIHKLQDSNDLVIASRFTSFQRDFAGVTPLRYLATYFFNQILKCILGFATTDNMSGFYAIRKAVLAKLPATTIYRGYGEYHLRLVWHAAQCGLKIGEVPIRYGPRKNGVSKSNLLYMFANYSCVALMLRLTTDVAILRKWGRFH